MVSKDTKPGTRSTSGSDKGQEPEIPQRKKAVKPPTIDLDAKDVTATSSGKAEAATAGKPADKPANDKAGTAGAKPAASATGKPANPAPGANTATEKSGAATGKQAATKPNATQTAKPATTGQTDSTVKTATTDTKTSNPTEKPAPAKADSKIADKKAETGKSANSGSGSGATPPPAASGRKTTEPAKGGTSFIALLVAGLLGGAIGGGGLFVGAQQGLIKLGGTEQQDALAASNKRLKALEEKIAALKPGADAESIAALQLKVSAFEKQSQTGSTLNKEAKAALNKALNDAANLGKEAKDRAATFKTTIAGLEAQINDMRDRLAKGAGGETVALETMQATLRKMEGRVAAVEGASAAAVKAADEAGKATKQAVGAVEAAKLADGAMEAIGTLRQQVGDLQTRLGMVKPLADSVKRLSTQLGTFDPIAETAAAKSRDDKLVTLRSDLDKMVAGAAQLDTRLAEVEKGVGGINLRETATLSVAMTALSSAVEAGRPFTRELATVRALLPNKALLDGLNEAAKAGVANKETLAKGFEKPAQAILAKYEATNSGEDGVLGKFLLNAKSIVKVRPSGAVDGDDAGAIVSRIRANLKTGNLAKAHAEWAKLEKPYKDLSQAWASQLQARLNLDRLTQQVTQDVLKTLAGSNG